MITVVGVSVHVVRNSITVLESVVVVDAVIVILNLMILQSSSFLVDDTVVELIHGIYVIAEALNFSFSSSFLVDNVVIELIHGIYVIVRSSVDSFSSTLVLRSLVVSVATLTSTVAVVHVVRNSITVSEVVVAIYVDSMI